MIIEKVKRENSTELFVRLDVDSCLWLIYKLASAIRNVPNHFHTYNQAEKNEVVHFMITETYDHLKD